MSHISNRYLLIALAMASTILCAGYTFAKEKSLSVFEQIIDSQIEAFQSGRNERAYSFAAPVIRLQYETSDKFVDMVREYYSPVFNPAWYQFDEFQEIRGRPLQAVLIQGPEGKIWKAIYQFENVSGEWKISGVRLFLVKAAGA
ncbi:DUF4864 domain-containing protein [Sneathiella limimaris]|uniref:DUF4864 domain-containing protein n=1 Tax=Sneathiella limimaris TaxID=1964213 RepID=UPI00146BE26F|nr:DUF4864 domain-containing protein [Sneathiella limimaris]